MPAVKLEVLCLRQCLADVTGEADRDDRVVATPYEQARWLQSRQPGPEAIPSIRLLEVDVPGCGVERGAAPRGQVGTEELVDSGRGPLLIGPRDQPPNDPVDDRPRS